MRGCRVQELDLARDAGMPLGQRVPATTLVKRILVHDIVVDHSQRRIDYAGGDVQQCLDI